MVLTKEELITSLQNEVRILLHLTTKLEPTMLDYRPAPKQRSTIELLRYLTLMGPRLIEAVKTGNFDRDAWQAAAAELEKASFDEVLKRIATHHDAYAELLNRFSDAELRGNFELFGRNESKGSFIVNMVLSGCAAYRTQLFLYLKACGREELTTMNLWGGVDPPVAAA